MPWSMSICLCRQRYGIKFSANLLFLKSMKLCYTQKQDQVWVFYSTSLQSILTRAHPTMSFGPLSFKQYSVLARNWKKQFWIDDSSSNCTNVNIEKDWKISQWFNFEKLHKMWSSLPKCIFSSQRRRSNKKTFQNR